MELDRIAFRRVHQMSAGAPERPSISLSVRDHSAWPDIAGVWADLAEKSPYTTFFLTPEWVESWLGVFGESLRPQLLLFSRQSTVVGACLLVRRIERKGPFRLTRVYLNTAGENEADSACIEFNALLCLEGSEEAVAGALADHLRNEHWDEFELPGMSPGATRDALEHALAGFTVRRHTVPSHFVKLRALRDSGSDYASSLQRKVRSQVRSYLRRYEELGTIRLVAARDTAEALLALERLAELHQERWSALDLPGAFASSRFVAFHRALIERVFPIGGAQLLDVRAGTEEVGFLYNFVHRGKVYFYQCGLRYLKDNAFKPGFVTHVAAVNYALESGLDEYDMMAGDQRYKKELAVDSRILTWLVFERANPKIWAIRCLRSLKDRLPSGFWKPAPELRR
jgi:CelD/BcsL family acetyltransferase involved in cellulose biosynthesis